VIAVADGMLYEERVGVVEHMLRQFSAFEMSSFLDFLPYIWEDLAVQYVNKLLLKMSPADRVRISSQLAAAERNLGGADEAAGVNPSSASPTKLSVSPDPSQLLPNELAGWTKLGPLSSGGSSYDLPTLLAIGNECLQLGATQFEVRHLQSADGADPDLVGLAATLSRAELPWTRLVYTVLLRRSIPPPKRGLNSAQCAREALWTFLTALRTHGKSNGRAKLLARLCGVLRYEYHDHRVALAFRVLGSLVPPSALDLGREVWLPMQALGEGAGYRGAHALPAELPSLLRTLDGKLGGAQKVFALIERLNKAAVADPRPKPLAVMVVDADTALMAIVDAFDAARVKLATQLATLHERIELGRGSSALDPVAFCSAIRTFDPTLEEPAAVAVYTDCELGAVEEREGSAKSGEDAAPISQRVFIRVCEEHGLRRSKDGD